MSDRVMRGARSLVVVLIQAATFPAAAASAQQPASGQLGEVHFENSCAAAVRERFDHATALLHHMTYAQAREEYAAIAAADPTCAMAHWGIAMTLFQPLWPTRPDDADLRRGWQEVQKAESIRSTSARERLFIRTVHEFFDPARKDYWDRIGRWADATRRLHDAHPRDVEAQAFFALSQLATAPPSGDMTHHEQAAAILAGILREHPTHPGAVHYLIHANDAQGREHESLDVVRRYGEIAPRNPHALHMPTHIFARLGDWRDVIDWNQRAAEAALEHPAGDRGQWVWDEFPHAIEYLVYANLQLGDDQAAMQAMRRLQRTANLQPSFKTAFHLASIPARHALERREWTLAAELDPRPGQGLDWARFPWPEAVTWFARALGTLHSGNIAAARNAEARITRLEQASDSMGEALFARQTEILKLVVGAWLAHAEHDDQRAIERMQRAVTLEASTPKPPVTPAPTLPAQEQLGDLYLALGRSPEALAAFEASLRTNPGRFNSLVGAARAARLSGDDAGAARYYRQLRELAVPGSTRPELAEAGAFLTGR